MKNRLIIIVVILLVLVASYIVYLIYKGAEDVEETLVLENTVIFLPLPAKVSNLTVEEAILLRRSIREFTSDPLEIEKLSMLLWTAQGITEPRKRFRAAPSAGATYPLEIYVAVKKRGVKINSTHFLEAGIYKYKPHTHSLKLVKKGDFSKNLESAALGQKWVGNAPINIIVTAVFERTTAVYGERGRIRYVPMEVGHVGQNIYLMATALDLGTVVVGAFYDNQVSEILGLAKKEVPMYIIPVGVPSEKPTTTFEKIHEYILKNRE